MKRFGFAGWLLVALLFATQVASAQAGGQECPWGYPSYDSVTHTFGSQCSTNVKVEAAAKPVGLAAPVVAVGTEQGRPGCPWGAAYDPLANGYMPACFGRPAATADSKPAGLAKPAQMSGSNQGQQECPWGYPAYDAATHAFVSQCASR